MKESEFNVTDKSLVERFGRLLTSGGVLASVILAGVEIATESYDVAMGLAGAVATAMLGVLIECCGQAMRESNDGDK